VPEGSVYAFVTSPEEAVEKATETPGDKHLDVFSAGVGGQLLRAGLVDEVCVHLVPVLLGAGTRLFENLGDEHIRLETTKVIETSSATHRRFRVLR
jgi:dihydrofolate reductase